LLRRCTTSTIDRLNSPRGGRVVRYSLSRCDRRGYCRVVFARCAGDRQYGGSWPEGQRTLTSSPRNGSAVIAGGACHRVRAKRGPMINSASVSKDGHDAGTRGHPSRRAQGRAPQDEGLACPGRCAARSGALLIRGRLWTRIRGPGSAEQREERCTVSGTRDTLLHALSG
jgi:hypothetical protein